jgi:hypothetical protein
MEKRILQVRKWGIIHQNFVECKEYKLVVKKKRQLWFTGGWMVLF